MFKDVKIVSCDRCHKHQEIDGRLFPNGFRYILPNGWFEESYGSAAPIHLCPSCRKKYHLLKVFTGMAKKMG